MMDPDNFSWSYIISFLNILKLYRTLFTRDEYFEPALREKSNNITGKEQLGIKYFVFTNQDSGFNHHGTKWNLVCEKNIL